LVIGGQFSITKRSVLGQVLGVCFKSGGVGTPQTAFTTQPGKCVAAWIANFRALNAAFPLVATRGFILFFVRHWATNVVQAARNQYATSVENERHVNNSWVKIGATNP